MLTTHPVRWINMPLRTTLLDTRPNVSSNNFPIIIIEIEKIEKNQEKKRKALVKRGNILIDL